VGRWATVDTKPKNGTSWDHFPEGANILLFTATSSSVSRTNRPPRQWVGSTPFYGEREPEL